MGFTIGAAAISAAGSIGSSVISSGAASSAAGKQLSAEQQALAAQQGYYNQAQSNLNPFITTGTSAENQLAQLTGTAPGGNPLTAPLTAQFNPSDLAATPGYQFSLNQGLKATQNQLTASGLGGSGQAVAGAGQFAQGLANTTYNQQLQNYLTQNQQTYNMLGNLANGGANAAGLLGQLGMGTGSQVGNTFTQIGNAAAAGTLGSANAATSGLSGISSGVTGSLNQAQTFNYLNNLQAISQGSAGGSTTSTSPFTVN